MPVLPASLFYPDATLFQLLVRSCGRNPNQSSAPHVTNLRALTAGIVGMRPASEQPRVIIVIPAHNEEAGIALALDSLQRQTRKPDLVIVVADRCTDATERIVGEAGGATVLATVGNADKKAGALNLVLEPLLPRLDRADSVLVMDADSTLDDGFVEGALERLGTPSRRGSTTLIAGVGGTFRGGAGGGFVGMLQRNEYARYARDVRRLKGRVLVLTGTASLFSVAALRCVSAARVSGAIPGEVAQVYDTHVLTEDNELTLALLHLGYGVVSPRKCRLETEVMKSWGDLWRQRVRWKRGAIENLADYGLTRVTARYWGRQLLTHVGVLVTTLYLLTLVYSVTVSGGIKLHPV